MGVYIRNLRLEKVMVKLFLDWGAGYPWSTVCEKHNLDLPLHWVQGKEEDQGGSPSSSSASESSSSQRYHQGHRPWSGWPRGYQESPVGTSALGGFCYPSLQKISSLHKIFWTTIIHTWFGEVRKKKKDLFRNLSLHTCNIIHPVSGLNSSRRDSFPVGNIIQIFTFYNAQWIPVLDFSLVSTI